MGYGFLRVSAMTGEGVKEAFTRLLEDVHDSAGAGDADKMEGTVDLGKKKEAGKGGCC